MELLIYITWAIALTTTFINFFFDNKKVILGIQCVTLFFYGTHLYLLWGIASAWLLYMQIGRNLFFDHKFSRAIMTVWLVVLVVIYFYIYIQNRAWDPLSWLSLLGTILGTLGCWATNTTRVRLLFFISTLPWIYYTSQIAYPFAFILQMTFMISIAINIVRFDILKTKK